MKKKNIISRLWFAPLALLITSNASADYPIAGVKPFERPVGAPVISNMNKGSGWYEQALTGITKPYPPSLKFLENQGNWYTPFNRPGMTPPYDIRGWHN
jgi:hypothetical protein